MCQNCFISMLQPIPISAKILFSKRDSFRFYLGRRTTDIGISISKISIFIGAGCPLWSLPPRRFRHESRGGFCPSAQHAEVRGNCRLCQALHSIHSPPAGLLSINISPSFQINYALLSLATKLVVKGTVWRKLRKVMLYLIRKHF